MLIVKGSFRDYRQLMVVAALTLSTLVSVGLFALRVKLSDRWAHLFLNWNLFLAWLPMIWALTAYNLFKRPTGARRFLTAIFAALWLLFLPNAPYLVTDIVNLSQRHDMPFWYDILLFAAYIWTGMSLGLVSLFLMQEIIRKIAGRIVSWVFALGALGLSSFGVYLGRFGRWNSWDVVTNPVALLRDILGVMRYPRANLETYIFSILFALFILSAYLILMALTHFRQAVVEADAGAIPHPEGGHDALRASQRTLDR